jgi:hypothetical protein
MADAGRIAALIIASPAGAVVHERFHVRLTELERADLRSALAANAAGLVAGCDRPRPGGAPPPLPPDGAQAVGRHRGAVLVSHVEGGLVLHGAGTGDCDELTGEAEKGPGGREGNEKKRARPVARVCLS